MKIDIEYIAHLARIELTEKEKQKFSEQLAKVLEYMNKLNEIDTSNIKPTSHPIELKQLNIDNIVKREDIVKQFENKKALLSNAPDSEGQYFKVPKVID